MMQTTFLEPSELVVQTCEF